MKIKLTVIFLGIAILSSQAQILVGPVAGGQLSWVSFNDKDLKKDFSVRPLWGFHAGGALSFRVHRRFFLHSSFLYSTKGKVILGKEDELLENRVRYHYIDVPLLYAVDFKAQVGRLKEFKYYFGMGPNISYWLGGKGEIFNSDLSEDTELANNPLEYTIAFEGESEDIHKMTVAEANRLQLGLNLAAGVVFEPLTNQKVIFMVRYEAGHSFFSRTSNGLFPRTYYQDVLQSRNQGFRVSFSYLVDLRTEDRKRGKSTIRKKRL